MYLNGGATDQTLYIREGGTADKWLLVTPAPGTRYVNDVFNLSDYNVVVEADYVILRGLELKNAGRPRRAHPPGRPARRGRGLPHHRLGPDGRR